MEQAPTVLIVDDNPTTIKILEASLVKQGFQTITTFFAQEAQTIAQQKKPNLILLDTQLSADETGFDVIKSLKKNKLTASIPVIFLGEDNIESKLTGFDLGAVDYITKPFHPLEVCARVRVHLGKSKTLKKTTLKLTKRMKRNKILIADDHDEIRRLMAEAVSYLDCEVSVASDGEETLKMIMKNKPDILVLDINMPKKNGFEVLKTIKENKTTQDIYVIVFTVRNKPKDIEMGYALGADVYFCKPRDVVFEIKKALDLLNDPQSEESSGKMA